MIEFLGYCYFCDKEIKDGTKWTKVPIKRVKNVSGIFLLCEKCSKELDGVPFKIDLRFEHINHINRCEATQLLEDVLDTLVEIRNGITEKHLKEVCNKLVTFRDKYFKVEIEHLLILIKKQEEEKNELISEVAKLRNEIREIKNES